jgi:hypothetical protein
VNAVNVLKKCTDRSFCIPISLLQCKSSKLSVKVNGMTGTKFSASDNLHCGILGCNATQITGTVAPDEHSLHQRD